MAPAASSALEALGLYPGPGRPGCARRTHTSAPRALSLAARACEPTWPQPVIEHPAAPERALRLAEQDAYGALGRGHGVGRKQLLARAVVAQASAPGPRPRREPPRPACRRRPASPAPPPRTPRPGSGRSPESGAFKSPLLADTGMGSSRQSAPSSASAALWQGLARVGQLRALQRPGADACVRPRAAVRPAGPASRRLRIRQKS